ncbi:unnamed protein product [Mytilus coruscus]|uniref:Core-binding (CB) domain-containing protein n=1 Tax=Mytilus coruscus TaxID=42192 RepID=A0A6J8DJ40_MYTCO|nr:unnamed protein product [Mytilus coruscus]
MAKNTWTTYKTALESLEKFSKEYDLNVSRPVQIDVLTRFIAYLSDSGLTSSTITTYLSGISHKHKLLGVIDTTYTFIVTKMLEGVRRKRPKLSDIRAPVTLEIIQSLPSVCSSHNESCMFASAFSLAFNALLRIGEFMADTNTDIGVHTLFINDLSLKFSNNKYKWHLKFRSSKADQRDEINHGLVICHPNMTAQESDLFRHDGVHLSDVGICLVAIKKTGKQIQPEIMIFGLNGVSFIVEGELFDSSKIT